jgi:hypothetical protein
MTRAAKIPQAEVQRMIRAVENEGKQVAAVDMHPGGVVRLLIGEPFRAGDLAQESADEWDRLIAAQ